MKTKIISVIMIVIAVIIAIVGYVILPDQVIIQIGSDGKASNIVPKIFGVLIPLALTVFGAIMLNLGDQSKKWTYIIVAIAGYVVAAFTFIMNL